MSCWITLGQVSTALEHANGVLTKRFVSLAKSRVISLCCTVLLYSNISFFDVPRPTWTSAINSFRVEACWRLGQWDELESYAKLVSGIYMC